MKMGILGGGLSGLTLGGLLNHDFEILEKEVECGGLCRTHIEDGFVFDRSGCHILFSRDHEALGLLLGALGNNKVRKRRNSKVLHKDRYVKYPFENGLFALLPQDNFECLQGFVEAVLESVRTGVAPPRTFKEWCYRTFGRGIAEKYLIPYNEKIWKCDTADMSAHWVDGRVPQPRLEDVVKSAVGIETEGYTHQLYYYYPKKGGIQSITRSLEKSLGSKIHTGFEVTRVSHSGQGWLACSGNDSRYFDLVVSTMPVFDLVAALEGVPEAVKEAAAALRYNRLITVMLGLDVPTINQYTAVYIADKSILCHRLGFVSNFSDFAAPQGKSSILAEISCSQTDDELWTARDELIVRRVTDDLVRLGIIDDRKRVCYQKVERSKYAYVVYDLSYQRNIGIVKDFFATTGIELLGRFSRFEYLNMDACVRQAMTLAERLNANAR
jgi:protoporphyrinogen oxidase